MEVKLDVAEIKMAQEWDEDAGCLIATLKLKAKVDGKDVMNLAYLQSVPPPVQCVLSSSQKRMKMLDTDTGELQEGGEE